MRIVDKKLIFIHIPKNAGTSIEYFLSGEKSGDPHRRDLALLKEIVSGRYQDYFKFTLVRNPYARLVSIFNHYTSKGGNQSEADTAIGEALQKLGFWGFIQRLDSLDSVLPCFEEIETHVMQQHLYCCGEDKTIALDHVGCYENLVEETAMLRERFGIEREFPHKYRTAKVDYRDYFEDRRLARIVEARYETDFDLFGYPRLG